LIRTGDDDARESADPEPPSLPLTQPPTASPSRSTCPLAARSPGWRPTSGPDWRARSRNSRLATSTTSADRSSSSRSRSSRSTTRPAASGRSSRAAPPRSARRQTGRPAWSSWDPARRARPRYCSTRWGRSDAWRPIARL